MNNESDSRRWVTLEVVDGVEGASLYLEDYRIAGPKPWGGGHVVKTFKVRYVDLVSDIKKALERLQGKVK